MKIRDIILEGGWDTKLTQNTVLHPRIVAVALQVVDKFVGDFNRWLANRGVGSVPVSYTHLTLPTNREV